MCSVLKWLCISIEEKGFSVGSPSFVLHVFFQLCNATPLKLLPDINPDKLCSPQRLGGGQWQLLGFAAAICMCHCYRQCVLVKQEHPAQLSWSCSSLSVQYILAQCLQEPPCLVPMFPGHLYRLYTRFSPTTPMFFSSSVKLDLLNYFSYMTSVEKW